MNNTAIQNQREIIQSFKAKMDKKRTFLERSADRITEIAGGNTFLFLNILWFVVWIVINVKLISSIQPFDPFPFSFLTAAVSLEAIVLAILVLISQNRSARIADIREEIQLQVNVISEQEITKIIEMLELLLEKNNVSLKDDKELREMLKPTDREKIEDIITKELAPESGSKKDTEPEK